MGTLAPDIDPDTLALLREAGIDPKSYLKRQLELRERATAPETAARLAAEQESLSAEIESCNRMYDEYGLWSDGLRSW